MRFGVSMKIEMVYVGFVLLFLCWGLGGMNCEVVHEGHDSLQHIFQRKIKVMNDWLRFPSIVWTFWFMKPIFICYDFNNFLFNKV